MDAGSLGAQVERFLGIKHDRETRAWYAKYLTPMVEAFGAESRLRLDHPHRRRSLLAGCSGAQKLLGQPSHETDPAAALVAHDAAQSPASGAYLLE